MQKLKEDKNMNRYVYFRQTAIINFGLHIGSPYARPDNRPQTLVSMNAAHACTSPANFVVCLQKLTENESKH